MYQTQKENDYKQGITLLVNMKSLQYMFLFYKRGAFGAFENRLINEFYDCRRCFIFQKSKTKKPRHKSFPHRLFIIQMNRT